MAAVLGPSAPPLKRLIGGPSPAASGY